MFQSVKRKYIVDTVGPLPVVLLVMDADTNNAVLNSFIYDNDSRILAQYDGDWQAGADKYFYLNDRLGSVRLIIDDTASAVSRYTYDPFGNTLDDECEIDADLYNPFMFTGQWFDEEIDQYYLRARYYDPYIGRFSTRDPVCGDLKMPMTLHVYLYALNNPINRIDPTGRFSMIGVKKKAESYSELMSFRGAAITAVVNSNASIWDKADALFLIQNSIAMRVLDSLGSHSVGWEAGFLVGGIGKTNVTCHDGTRVRTMQFKKYCFGAMIGYNWGLAHVHGIDGPQCNPKSYDGYFFEGAFSAGPIGYDVHIGLSDDFGDPFGLFNPNEPTFSGTWEYGGNVGLDPGGLKGAFCYYVHVGDI